MSQNISTGFKIIIPKAISFASMIEMRSSNPEPKAGARRTPPTMPAARRPYLDMNLDINDSSEGSIG